MKPDAIYTWAVHLKNEELEELIGSSVVLDYKKNDVIIKQGSLATQILVLEEGMVKLNFEERGKDTTFGFGTKGDFIGLMCSFVKKRLDFSAVAITPCRIRVFNRDVFEKLIGQNGRFAIYIVTMMSELINAAVHKLITLSHRNVNGALATLLLSLKKVFGEQRITLPFTREEMAHTLSYSKESIINTLSDFQQDGIITVSGKHLEILDLTALESIAENG
ncbi:MAG: Crp/Fnr family transcriptional regulator [Bacteroidales bacterium]|nr:Crp/Fnr family transcriptional regulator [Bacteroidales bacterium]MDD3522016.1 Crp/Fnr family transcriptional regulator [Bacteroidales bacterium]MDD4031000.1 Crp/Fnr family transcriptional regulator [Bacteroidales bacterium]MDD4435725.1 Crp/Fnr family transcriptional regulator [Bacteroidales bacterium]MDD5732939.1 Crp/Fnr family transcriptional regulator [Bacteroidales bacterium]